MFKYLW